METVKGIFQFTEEEIPSESLRVKINNLVRRDFDMGFAEEGLRLYWDSFAKEMLRRDGFGDKSVHYDGKVKNIPGSGTSGLGEPTIESTSHIDSRGIRETSNGAMKPERATNGEEWIKTEARLREYLLENPGATRQDVVRKGFGSILVYYGNFRNLKRVLGIKKILSDEAMKESKEKVRKYLESNIYASWSDVVDAGLDGVIKSCFGSLRKAKKEFNIPNTQRMNYNVFFGISHEERMTYRRELILRLRKKPSVKRLLSEGFGNNILFGYGGSIPFARSDVQPMDFSDFHEFDENEKMLAKRVLIDFMMDYGVDKRLISSFGFGPVFQHFYKGNMEKLKADVKEMEEMYYINFGISVTAIEEGHEYRKSRRSRTTCTAMRPLNAL